MQTLQASTHLPYPATRTLLRGRNHLSFGLRLSSRFAGLAIHTCRVAFFCMALGGWDRVLLATLRPSRSLRPLFVVPC